MKTETLVTQIQQGFVPQWLHFWGHTPSKDGNLGKNCFSQWWAGHPFVIDDITYATAEHYMMAEKARLFGDNDTLQKILPASTPAIAKKLGREVKNFDDARWLQNRWEIVVSGNFAKFSQHADLRDFLLHTGDRVIVEASPFDRIWGIGMAATDPNAENPAQWKGLNLLGFALMEVRKQLREKRP
ncbi:NADAR family protein [Prosthecobacter sp.]|uniref:NADAR family protein n=1 Tax=Prosthecobacter sp. TaxID=1965333 RepID=UPI003784C016